MPTTDQLIAPILGNGYVAFTPHAPQSLVEMFARTSQKKYCSDRDRRVSKDMDADSQQGDESHEHPPFYNDDDALFTLNSLDQIIELAQFIHSCSCRDGLQILLAHLRNRRERVGIWGKVSMTLWLLGQRLLSIEKSLQDLRQSIVLSVWLVVCMRL